jgi:DNA helicase-2/ATP-dependent DNA helicase PcrA
MNPKQLRAATSTARWELILAGPGSGKTTVLVERAKWLSAQGVKPSNMAYVTFTNIGATVMKKRLVEAVGPVGFVGTLHSMMLRFLRRSNSNWTMIGDDDAAEFIKRSAKKLGYRGSAEELEHARKWTSNPERTSAHRVISVYEQMLRESHMLDYNMVLTEGLRLLKESPEINPWGCWSVDEFQDSAAIDKEIYMQAKPEWLTLVADSDQAVFEFRGADPKIAIALWNTDDRFEKHVLDLNYRCGRNICQVANAVIRQNAHRVSKETVSATETDGEVTTRCLANDKAEAEEAALLAADYIATGTAPKEIAVLCRTNKAANTIRDALAAAGVPVATGESEKLPRDWPLLTKLIAQVTTPSNWSTAILLARAIARSKKEDPDDAEKWVVEKRDSRRWSTAAAVFSLPTFEMVRTLNANFSRFGISKATHLVLAERIRIYDPTTPEELMACVQAPIEGAWKNGVSVMTVHSAKGEEWNNVIVAGADMYRFRTPSEQEAERRLFFVAVTRARRVLAVLCATERSGTLPGGRTFVVQNKPGELYEITERLAEHYSGVT